MTAPINPQPGRTRDGVPLAPLAGGFLPPYSERLHHLTSMPEPSQEAAAALMSMGEGSEGASEETRAVIAAMEAWGAPFGEPEETHAVAEDRTIDGPHGPVPVRVYRPEPGWEPPTPAATGPDGARPALVWYHGGAFVGGDLDMPEADLVARGLTTRTGSTVVSVFYRLCHDGVHHPVPHDDGYAAFRWTVEHAVELGVDASRVAVGGASAGGNIAAGVALHARDDAMSGLVAVWQALLAYPVAHAEHWPASSPELAARQAELPWVLRFPPGMMEHMNGTVLGGAVRDVPAYAFPGDGNGTAADLAGFPSTYVENCENDDLRTSGEAFARQLAGAGVDVECVTAAGVPHGHLNAVGSPLTSATLDRFAARLARRP